MHNNINKETSIFTIITVVFNGKNEIERTIQSVLNQSYSQIEYIIIDGGSTDGTIEIIYHYSSKIKELVSETDDGIFDAMNKGLLLASGDYVNFMNAGDIFVSNDIITNICKSDLTNIDFIYGDTIRITKYGRKEYKSNPFWLRKGIHEMGICHQSIFIRTQLAKKYMFDKSLKLSADYKMIFNIFSTEKVLALNVEFPISIFDGIEGTSSINYRRTYNEILTFINPYTKIQKLFFLYKSYTLYYFYQIYKHLKNSIAK